MPVIRVNQRDEGLELHRSPAPALAALGHAARAGDGPVIVMVHGFQFRPGDARACPHQHIFAPETVSCRTALSWPQALGLTGTGTAASGALGLAFGWDSKATIWTAYRRAAPAGAALARAIRTLRAAAPGREVHAIAHSLGARVVLQALPHLAPGDLGRIIALNPAEFRAEAEAALATPAGRAAELIAVTSRENAGYDLMLEALVQPPRRGDRALGRGLSDGIEASGRRLMLRLDRPEQEAHLARLGFPLAPRRRRPCHWSPYLRDGAMALYASLMRDAARLPLAALCPPEPTRAPRAALRRPLPLGGKAPS